ncbi:hypothetical protein B0J15DRAFT_518062 [Fusarium solani]|uniref:Uncharacterized protein n=1 Tax=Fusarium solani TaxID=169388 RepID=A0A9P9G056_FUSSL|nr:uncharacterized protein B0J15DRAFT_518062 [Fusarium solani]KAH7230830.1 hypothetical protein B0J15DRAFT_518062 [Fusarium solani]
MTSLNTPTITVLSDSESNSGRPPYIRGEHLDDLTICSTIRLHKGNLKRIYTGELRDRLGLSYALEYCLRALDKAGHKRYTRAWGSDDWNGDMTPPPRSNTTTSILTFSIAASPTPALGRPLDFLILPLTIDVILYIPEEQDVVMEDARRRHEAQVEAHKETLVLQQTQSQPASQPPLQEFEQQRFQLQQQKQTNEADIEQGRSQPRELIQAQNKQFQEFIQAQKLQLQQSTRHPHQSQQKPSQNQQPAQQQHPPEQPSRQDPIQQQPPPNLPLQQQPRYQQPTHQQLTAPPLQEQQKPSVLPPTPPKQPHYPMPAEEFQPEGFIQQLKGLIQQIPQQLPHLHQK